VTGRAGSLIVHDVRAVKFKTLIGQNAVAAVAFVAKRVSKRTFRLVIGCDKIPFQNRRINRTMRPVRTGAARLAG